MAQSVFLRKTPLQELAKLQAVCKSTYVIYFEDYWRDQGLALYLEEQYGTERLNADLKDNAIGYFFIENEKQEVLGFLKINYAAVFADCAKEEVCELEKMYLLPEHKGKGIGQIALTILIESLRETNKQIFFLCVLDTNKGSILFYEKLGFQFHSKIRLSYKYFKEELKGLNRMYMRLD